MPNNYYRVENKNFDAGDLSDQAERLSRIETHRRRIEPWLSAIFQSEYLNLLIGSGFSIGLARAAEAAPANMGLVSFDPAFDDLINTAASTAALAMGRGEPNIEDQFRAAITLEGGLAILNDPRRPAFRTRLRGAIAAFANSILAMESSILEKDPFADEGTHEFERLLSEFLLSFVSRTASRDRLHIFTTNYDRMIEHGFDLIGVRPIDRFVGSLTPRFRASRFDVDIHYAPTGARGDARPLEGVVRFTKLHGSIDWKSVGHDIVKLALPFGADAVHSGADADGLMIFPNSAKDIETAFYPYAELFRDFSQQPVGQMQLL